MARCVGCAGCNCVVDGVTITGTGVLGDPFVAVGGGGGSGGPPLEGTYYVAAVDSRPQIKAQADFVCDGVADEVQIQAAIDAAYVHGFGVVVLSEGTFTLSNTINFNNQTSAQFSVSIRGVGMGGGEYIGPQPPTKILRPVTMTLPAILVSNPDSISISNIYFYDVLTNADKDPMISLDTFQAIVIEHCYFNNETNSFPSGRARSIDGRAELKVRYCSFKGTPGACIVARNIYQIMIIGNYFFSTTCTAGAFGSNEYAIILEGNPGDPATEGGDWPFIISHNFGDGSILGAIQINGVAQGLITDNVILYDNTSTIQVTDCFEIQIQSNQLGGENTQSIELIGSTYIQINDNQIIEPGTHGITLSGCNDCQINNNSIVAGANAASAAIFIDADSNTNMVTGNQIRGTTLYGIRVNSVDCDDNWVTNNDLKNSATTPFSDAGTGTITTAGNRF